MASRQHRPTLKLTSGQVLCFSQISDNVMFPLPPTTKVYTNNQCAISDLLDAVLKNYLWQGLSYIGGVRGVTPHWKKSQSSNRY